MTAVVWSCAGTDMLGPFVEAGLDRVAVRALERVRCEGCQSMDTSLAELERKLLELVGAVRHQRELLNRRK